MSKSNQSQDASFHYAKDPSKEGYVVIMVNKENYGKLFKNSGVEIVDKCPTSLTTYFVLSASKDSFYAFTNIEIVGDVNTNLDTE
jgi:hypothetical protein